MWPCGTVTFIDRSESKAQVYGCYTNPSSTKDISKEIFLKYMQLVQLIHTFVDFLCYDDACH